jgi:ketosteroid isomerase-like protein
VSERNKQIVQSYFESLAKGDGRAIEWLADDVRWWVPQGSSLGGSYQGKPAVLELMGRGVDLYSPDVPMRIDVQSLVAEGDRVCAEVEITAVTHDDRPYCNQYHFALRLRDDRIVEVKEYVDTRYVYDMLGV